MHGIVQWGGNMQANMHVVNESRIGTLLVSAVAVKSQCSSLNVAGQKAQLTVLFSPIHIYLYKQVDPI